MSRANSHSARDRAVFIGCGSGFWGDSAIAVPQLLTAPRLDYIVFDYLAETTMSILQRARLKDPELGYAVDSTWDRGTSWRLGTAYLVVECGPDVRGSHDRVRAGLNHLALHAGSRADVDALVREAPERGWSLLFADRHPYAGGPTHYAAYLEDAEGFEVELVADDA